MEIAPAAGQAAHPFDRLLSAQLRLLLYGLPPLSPQGCRLCRLRRGVMESLLAKEPATRQHADSETPRSAATDAFKLWMG